jgi:hypothetical protein
VKVAVISGGVVFTSRMKEVFQLVKKLLDMWGGGWMFTCGETINITKYMERAESFLRI